MAHMKLMSHAWASGLDRRIHVAQPGHGAARQKLR